MVHTYVDNDCGEITVWQWLLFSSVQSAGSPLSARVRRPSRRPFHLADFLLHVGVSGVSGVSQWRVRPTGSSSFAHTAMDLANGDGDRSSNERAPSTLSVRPINWPRTVSDGRASFQSSSAHCSLGVKFLRFSRSRSPSIPRRSLWGTQTDFFIYSLLGWQARTIAVSESLSYIDWRWKRTDLPCCHLAQTQTHIHLKRSNRTCRCQTGTGTQPQTGN